MAGTLQPSAAPRESSDAPRDDDGEVPVSAADRACAELRSLLVGDGEESSSDGQMKLLRLLLVDDDGGSREAVEGHDDLELRLRDLAKFFFSHVERLHSHSQAPPSASTDDVAGAGVSTPPPTLSGLSDLLVGDVDAETVWAQVEMQNAALMGTLRKRVRRLAKRGKRHVTRREDGGDDGDDGDDRSSLVRLVDLTGISAEPPSEDEGSDAGGSDDGDDADAAKEGEEEADNDDGDEEEDVESRKIRERMERAMADADGSSSSSSEEENDSDDGSTTSSSDVKEPGAKDKDSEEVEGEGDLVDPAAEELNDGFFDINEMEEFADEEEDYHTFLDEDESGDEGGDGDSGDASEDDEQSEDDLERGSMRRKRETQSKGKSAEKQKKRKRYRGDDDIRALEGLYKSAEELDEMIEDEIGGGDDEDADMDVIHMTAADFFGKPNKRYFGKKHASSSMVTEWTKAKASPKISTDRPRGLQKDAGDGEGLEGKDFVGGDVDEDSWDDHAFDEEEEGAGADWRGVPITNKRQVISERKDDDNEGPDDDASASDESAGATKEHRPTHVATSSHAARSRKLDAQTAQLERELLAEKPWAMTGETTGKSRPVDSLLNSTPDFERASKQAPTITVEHTESLEDVIRRRILDEDWDDVVPRELPDIKARKRKADLDIPEVSTERSKLGLGELYERDYLKKAEGYDADEAERSAETSKVHGEIRALFASLCDKLDALSNYNFVPRKLGEEDGEGDEIKAATAAPAIAMEEVLPLHVSGARASAPEEVYGMTKGRSAVLRGESEVDQTERKRIRAAKKAARRKERRAKRADERLISRLQPGLGLNNPYEKRKLREDLSRARATGRVASGEVDASTSEYKTSAKFFKRMQEDVEKSVRGGNDHHDDGDFSNRIARKFKVDSGVGAGQQRSSSFKL